MPDVGSISGIVDGLATDRHTTPGFCCSFCFCMCEELVPFHMGEKLVPTLHTREKFVPVLHRSDEYLPILHTVRNYLNEKFEG